MGNNLFTVPEGD